MDMNKEKAYEHLTLGDKHRKQGKVSLAILEYLKGIKQDPTNPYLLSALADAYYEKGEVDKAINYYKQAANCDPQTPIPIHRLGIIYYQKGNLNQARECFEKVKSLKSDSALAYNNLGVIFAEEGRWEEAISHYKKALEINPEDALVYNNLGVVYAEKGEKGEAAKCYQKALELDPNQVTAHYCLGIDYEHRGTLEIGAAIKIGSLLKINSRWQIAGRDITAIYSSRIEDINKNSITIAAPLSRGEIVPLRPGMKVVVATPGEDALYGFYTKVKKIKYDPIPLLVLENPGIPPRRIQRRRYVRIDARVLKNMRILNRKEMGTIISRRQFREKDISAGGISINVPRTLPRGTILELELNIGGEVMKVAGQVVRCTPSEKEGYEAGIRFVGLTEKERHKIMQFVYSRQIEERRKGLR